MNIPSPDTLRSKLEASGTDVHFMRVTQDRQVMVCRTTSMAHSDEVYPVPYLFVHLCTDGGGALRRVINLTPMEVDVYPGAIGALPPGSKGTGHWPEMTAITFGISANVVMESLGKSWPENLQSKVISQIFRDPLVEATMMDMGYVRAGHASDTALTHAAHMIIHQLFGKPAAQNSNAKNSDGQGPSVSDVIPLDKTTISELVSLLDVNLDRNVSVSEMADLAGVSRHHFSRRFKAATGQSPLQFAIIRKLDHAATFLEQEREVNILNLAQSVGFTNPSHFARAFRRHFGLSPRHWKSEKMRAKDS